MHYTATHKGVALLIFRIVFYREGWFTEHLSNSLNSCQIFKIWQM